MRYHWISAIPIAALLTSLAACGDSTDATASPTGGRVQVVASTNVWGDIAQQIGGTYISVTSIITDPDADPHTYEANGQNQVAISKASLVIENGGGYDDFIDKMVKSAGSKATVLNAVDISGKTAPAGGDLNEHVWYDFPTVQMVAAQIEEALAKADPDNASMYQSNAQTFDSKLQAMEATEATIKAADAGDPVSITEPVPLYMLQACGLVNKTPSEFSEAIEEDSDVSPAVLKQTLDLYNAKQVELLAYNAQTSGPETEQVLKAAKDNGIAVIPVTETLPDGKDYLTWMQGYLSDIQSALG